MLPAMSRERNGFKLKHKEEHRCIKCAEERPRTFYESARVLMLMEAARLDELICTRCDPSFFWIQWTYVLLLEVRDSPTFRKVQDLNAERYSLNCFNSALRCSDCQRPHCHGCGSEAWNRKWVEPAIQRLTIVEKKCGKLNSCSG